MKYLHRRCKDDYKRKRYSIEKSRQKTRNIIKKSRKGVIDNRGGYMLVDAKNIIIAGERFDLTSEDVRKWLNQSKIAKDL